MTEITYRELRNQLTKAIDKSDRVEVERVLHIAPSQIAKVFDSHRFRMDFVGDVAEIDQEIIQLLVDAGMDLNRHDSEGPDGIYPIHSCIQEDAFDQAKFLLNRGADPQVCDGLFWVMDEEGLSSEAKIGWFELLTEFGADIHKGLRNIPEYTPIMKAMDTGDSDLVQFFKDRGAEAPEIPSGAERQLDLTTFQDRLEKACRECWKVMCSEFPAESFCLFGLETDSDFVILNALLDTEQAIERDSRNRRDGEAYVARVSLDADSEFYGKGNRFLDELSSELNSVVGAGLTDREDRKRMKSLKRIFEDTLKNLDQEGLFGRGEDREHLILLVSIIDADEREWKQMLKSAKRLNPSNVFKQFTSSMK